MNFECLVPVRAGAMEKFKFFWPSALPVTETWPPQEDMYTNDAGGGGIGMEAIGVLPVGFMFDIESDSVVWIGGPNVVFRPQSDWGDRHPTDVGYTAQTVINPAVYGTLAASPKPHLNLRTYTVRPLDLPEVDLPPTGITIDLAKTKVLDSSAEDRRRTTLLKTFFKGINEDKKLMLRDDALVAGKEEATLEGVVFDFKYDEETEKYGAGTAFLRDDD
jgi:hypothetical protein